MSYFICSYRADSDSRRALEASLEQILPPHLRYSPLRIGDVAHLAAYAHKKIIPHLTIDEPARQSWLAVLGTPLIRFERDEDRTLFLTEFLARPAEVLRDRVDGNFAIFAYDGTRDRFIAATDLNSSTPVFYAVTTNGVLFASHELALARHRTADVDPAGFAQTIQLGITWLSRTRFRGISKLLPGQILTVDRTGHLDFEQYWQPRDETISKGSLDEHIERWGSLLKEAVWRIYDCSGRQPVVADFTAGEDARLILAQCRALGIPFKAHVKGAPEDVDVVVATRAAKAAGFEIIRRERHRIREEELVRHGQELCLRGDAYLEYVSASSDYATDLAEPLDDYGVVKYGGVPGGEAFRGSYYLRGKAVLADRRRQLDYVFFTRMKFLLDQRAGLMVQPAAEFRQSLHQIAAETLGEVSDFPIGTQIDHMLRMFQTSGVGLMYKDPLYLPLATNAMTRSIYWLPPKSKRGGRLTKACTERLFPELAFVKTQSNVPTVRRTLRRQPMFVPEYVALIRTIANGAGSRLFKWRPSGAWQLSEKYSNEVFATVLLRSPYAPWFSSPDAMITGGHYNRPALSALLERARLGSSPQVATLSRIIGQELALRWVYGQPGI
ncbi:MAG: hypothetical protein WBC51_07670 [Vicinamibacterales bacterium]